MNYDELPRYDNLATCDKHGVMMHSGDDKRRCPLCELDGDHEVRRDADLPGRGGITPQEVRQRIDAEMMKELLPLVEEYINDRDDGGDVFMTVAACSGELPAGYTEAQERWINAVVYEIGMGVKAVTMSPAAKETIETLRDEGYGDEDDA